MLCNWLQIYYKTLLKPTDFLKKTTSPPALPCREGASLRSVA